MKRILTIKITYILLALLRNTGSGSYSQHGKYSCDISSAKQDYENTILEENDDPLPRTINNKAGLKYIGKIQYIFIGIS